MKSRIAPCKKGHEIRDYEAMANLPVEAASACDAMLRGLNPSYHLPAGVYQKSVGFLQAPTSSVIAGEVAVNERGKHGFVPLSAGVIVVVCISGIALLLICLCMLEIMSGLFWLRRRHSMSSRSNRQNVHDDHSRAPPEGNPEVVSSNPSGAVHSDRSFEIANSVVASTNDSQATGLKQGLARWVIKGLPLFKYRKQQVLHPGLNLSTNSASCAECFARRNVHGNCGEVIAQAAIDHDIESALSPQATQNDAASDHKRLECVVCLSPFEEDEAVRVLPKCCHAFHAACIDSWLILHSTCPLCRVQISSLDVCSTQLCHDV